MDWISSAIAGGSSLLGSAAQGIIGGINARQARKWSEDMYLQYNSPSALVRQYGEAGINPALMFGGQTPSAPTDTTPAPAPDNPFGSAADMIAQTLNLELLDYEKELKKQQVEDYKSQRIRRDYQNALDAAQANSVVKNTEWIDRVNEAKTNSDKASAARNFAEAAIAQEEKRLGHRLGSSEALAICNAIISALGVKPSEDGIIDGIAEEVADFITDDQDLNVLEAFGGPLIHLVAKKVRSRRNH